MNEQNRIFDQRYDRAEMEFDAFEFPGDVGERFDWVQSEDDTVWSRSMQIERFKGTYPEGENPIRIYTFVVKFGEGASVQEVVLDDAASSAKPDNALAPAGESKSVAAGAKAVEAHGDALGIEGDAATQVWHLILSLQEYCAANGLDFDTLIADVRQREADGEVESPLWRAFQKKRDLVARVHG